MKIAILGWGSLIWCPRELDITGRWRPGPALPVEFARISSDQRVTLVLVGDHPSLTFWALSAKRDIDEACENLRRREGETRRANIHYTLGDGLRTCNGEAADPDSLDVSGTVSDWLRTIPDLQAAIWTGLPPKGFNEPLGPGLAGEVVEHLRGLTGLAAQRAEEYVRFAPSTIQTPIRTAIELAFPKWQPEELPAGLFEDAAGRRSWLHSIASRVRRAMPTARSLRSP